MTTCARAQSTRDRLLHVLEIDRFHLHVRAHVAVRQRRVDVRRRLLEVVLVCVEFSLDNTFFIVVHIVD